MSDLTTVLPPELADIGLVALADPDFCERLLATLARTSADEPPARGAEPGAQNTCCLAA